MVVFLPKSNGHRLSLHTVCTCCIPGATGNPENYVCDEYPMQRFVDTCYIMVHKTISDIVIINTFGLENGSTAPQLQMTRCVCMHRSKWLLWSLSQSIWDARNEACHSTGDSEAQNQQKETSK